MKDSQASSNQASAELASRIEASILSVADAMRVYANRVQPKRPPFNQESRRLQLRHAPHTPELIDVFRGSGRDATCGIVPQPAHLLLRTGAPSPTSHHEAMEIAALAHATTTAMAGLADTLREIPLLAHDALQTEMDLHWPRDERDEITLSVEGISLTAQPGVSSGHAARAAAYLANLATISPPLSKDAWPFYQIQGHIVRAPGPGWAYLKLQLLISASLAARPDIRRALTQECPRILRIETEADMEADLAGLRLS